MKAFVREFESWEAFLNAAELPPPPGWRKAAGGSGSRDPGAGTDFYGSSNFEEAMQIARAGWRAGAERVMEIRAGLDRYIVDTTSELSQAAVFDTAGEWLDVGRMLSGEPECFGRYENFGDAKRSPVVCVQANISCSGIIGEDVIFQRGAVVIATVDLLETLGYRVELRVGSSAAAVGLGRDIKNDRYEFSALAKPASQPLDIDRLAFVLCHRSGLRRLGFSIYEQLGREGSGTPQEMLRPDWDGPFISIPHITSRNGWGDLSGKKLMLAVAEGCAKAGVIVNTEAFK